jgi:hypothetical protein
VIAPSMCQCLLMGHGCPAAAPAARPESPQLRKRGGEAEPIRLRGQRTKSLRSSPLRRGRAACAVADISDGGAKLKLDNRQDVPEGELVLILGFRQSPRRPCRIVWRKRRQGQSLARQMRRQRATMGRSPAAALRSCRSARSSRWAQNTAYERPAV